MKLSFTDGGIILMIIAASGALGFWQEHSAGRAVDALLARVRVRVEVYRDGRETSVPVEEVTVGDVVVLRAGDVIPADCRVIASHDLLVDEASLTGESFPAEKQPDQVHAGAPLAQRRCALFGDARVVMQHLLHLARVDVVAAPYDQILPAVHDEEEAVLVHVQRLAAYKYPRLVELRHALPMTAAGKVLKKVL